MEKISLNFDQRVALNFIIAILAILEIYFSFMFIQFITPYDPEISDVMLFAPLIGAFLVVLIFGLITRIPGLIFAGVVPNLILGGLLFLSSCSKASMCMKGSMMMGLIFFGVSLIFILFAPGWAIAILKKTHFLSNKTLLYLRTVKIITLICPIFLLLVPWFLGIEADILFLIFISFLAAQFYIVPTIVYSCSALKRERA